MGFFEAKLEYLERSSVPLIRVMKLNRLGGEQKRVM